MSVRRVVMVAGVLGVTGTASAETPEWKEKLSGSLVKVENQEMTWRSAQICRYDKTGESFQVVASARAPEGAGISRDFFLSFASSTEGLVMGALLGAVAGATNDRTVFSSVNCKSIESAIGTPEMTFDLTMTGDGWQWVLTAGEKTYRHTERWADSFAE